MYDEVGFVAEVTEGFGQKTKVAMPEKLVRADGKVGVEEDFQEIVILIKPYGRILAKLSQSECNKNIF
jgi:hypothetical protein